MRQRNRLDQIFVQSQRTRDGARQLCHFERMREASSKQVSLVVEKHLRFVDEAPTGPIKTFTLRGIKESPPYLHDGRCLTLEDTVEFFNLILQTKLAPEEKSDLVSFLRTL